MGEAIGKPEPPWIMIKDEDALNGMLQAGLSKDIAGNFVEMGTAIASGEMYADYFKHKPTLGPTKLEDFAKESAAVYSQE